MNDQTLTHVRSHGAPHRFALVVLTAALATITSPTRAQQAELSTEASVVGTSSLIQQAKFLNPDPNATASFGDSVAISGTTAVVGAPGFYNGGLQRGAASVFVQTNGVWALQQLLAISTRVGFGGSVAISGDTLVVGHALSSGVNEDTAWVYVRSNGVWTLQGMLKPSDNPPNVGTSVAISGNTALVAAGNVDRAVYVFVRNGTTWTEQKKLVQADDVLGEDDDFGALLGGKGVALDGDTALIGASHAKIGANTQQGAAYVFVRSGSSWTQQAKLIESAGSANKRFGGYVSFSGNTALVGPGNGYVFNRIGASWSEQAPLQIPASFPDKSVVSVSIDGDAAVVGIPFHLDFINDYGQAYTFRRIAGSWLFQEQLLASDGNPSRDHLGYDVSISGSLVIAGAPGQGASQSQDGPGAAYVFKMTGVNTPPTISGISSKATPVNRPIAVAFTVADDESGPAGVSVSASSSNTTLVPNANLALSGTAASRILTITPAANRTGVTTITLVASDGTGSSSLSFSLSVTSIRPGDFDGDTRSDVAVFRPSNGTWYIRNSGTGLDDGLVWGGAGDVPVPGDYDRDSLADMAVFRPSNGTWYIRNSSTGGLVTSLWGGVGDVPVQGDYDGDGRTDIAVFRASSGIWYIRNSNTGLDEGLLWGGAGDVPTPGDFDGDGKTDMAVFRPSNGTWYLRRSSNGALVTSLWGGVGNVPVAGDYDGDGFTDVAVFRASSGVWYIRNSNTGLDEGLLWGGVGDIPTPGDFDGDGKTDMAVFRPSNGTWYLRSSSNGSLTTVVWGGATDIPVLKRP